MRSQIFDVGYFGGRFHHVPSDASRRSPLIDGTFRLHRNRNCSDMLSLVNKVSDYAVLVLADLEIFDFGRQRIAGTTGCMFWVDKSSL